MPDALEFPAMPGTTVPLAMAISPDATNFNGNAAFGLTRVVARPYCKITFVLACNAAGNWVPQQSASAPIVAVITAGWRLVVDAMESVRL